MRRLLEDFDALFDLTHRVGDAPLGELLERALSGLEQPRQNWGSPGRREEVFSETGRFVSIYDEITSRQDIDKLDDDVTFLAVQL